MNFHSKGRTLQQEGDGILTYIDFRFVQLHLENLFCSVASYCTALLQVNILNVSNITQPWARAPTLRLMVRVQEPQHCEQRVQPSLPSNSAVSTRTRRKDNGRSRS